MTQYFTVDTYVFSNTLTDDEITQIIRDKINNKNLFLTFKISDKDFCRYALIMSERIQCDCSLIFMNVSVFFDSFEVWATLPYLKVKVEPFFSIVQDYIAYKTGSLDLTQKTLDYKKFFCFEEFDASFLERVFEFVEEKKYVEKILLALNNLLFNIKPEK
ncbi:MAG: hypothetical protein RMJ67_07825 [Elusimicrobiota bacterium]|nr:hypothetical protein [Endomicrobiia bacterium]MDW8166401.1 hypothetical protein [Elusimicrobiota bacterium]